MAENKTKENELSVKKFLDGIEDATKRKDSYELLQMMTTITGLKPKMWGGTIVGFGKYHYKYESGREGDTLRVGFSPRKNALTLYILNTATTEEVLKKLGKYKTGKSCLYIKKLADVDLTVLKELITLSFEYLAKKYPE